jgi:ABC-type nitrate/sulfonate/bicarbonate transport system substrate-binding protein
MYKVTALLLTIFIFHAGAHAADKIRIAIPSQGAQFMTYPLAQKKGFLKEEALEAEMIRTSGSVAIAALTSGDVDYFTAIGFPVRAAMQGLPVRVVACFFPTLPFVLITRPEIKSVSALRGQALGINAFGGAPEVITRMTLKHFGIDPDKEVKFVVTGSPESRLAAMNQGLTAATVVAIPDDYHAKKLGFSVVAKPYELFTYPDGGLTANVKKTKERPEEIKRVIRAGIKANRYIRSDRDGTIQFMMEWQKIPREIATITYESLSPIFNDDGSLPEKGLRLVIEENKKIAKVGREVVPGEVVDLSILKAAQSELSIKQR